MSNVISQPTPAIGADRAPARTQRRGSLVLILGAVITFGALAVLAHSTPYFPFDLAVTRAVQSIHAGWFDALMRAVNFTGYPPQVFVEIALALVIFWFIGWRWQAIALLAGNLTIGAVGSAVKMLVARPRPLPDLVYVANPALDGGMLSFPAGHVQGAVIGLGFLIYLLLHLSRRTAWQNALLVVAAALILLNGISRVYAGEHWFSDVVGGYLLGSIVLWLTIQLYEWGKPKFFRNEADDAQR